MPILHVKITITFFRSSFGFPNISKESILGQLMCVYCVSLHEPLPENFIHRDTLSAAYFPLSTPTSIIFYILLAALPSKKTTSKCELRFTRLTVAFLFC